MNTVIEMAVGLPIALVGVVALLRLFGSAAKKSKPVRSVVTQQPATRPYPHLGRTSARQAIWFDGALDRSRSRQSF